MPIRYPDITVKLTGEDGNAFSIIARVGYALQKAGVPGDVVKEFHTECMSGDYNHLLATAMDWVNVK